MQCPLRSCCFVSPKLIFIVIGCLGLALGILSVVWPQRSINLYQWIMERINWKVAPINGPLEIRNTRILGTILVVLSLTIFFLISSRC